MIDRKKFENDMFDTMWVFLEMGKQKSNYPIKKLCLD